MLTAMPHKHRAIRRAHLDALGFPYPLLTTETAKGPAIRQLRGEHPRPVAFVDDIPHNLVSVRAAVADAHLFHLMAHAGMRDLLPPLARRHRIAADWRDAGPGSPRRWGFDPRRYRHPISSETIFPSATTNVEAERPRAARKTAGDPGLEHDLAVPLLEFERLHHVIVFLLGLAHPRSDGCPTQVGPALVADYGIGCKAFAKMRRCRQRFRPSHRDRGVAGGRSASLAILHVAVCTDRKNGAMHADRQTDKKVRYLPERRSAITRRSLPPAASSRRSSSWKAAGSY